MERLINAFKPLTEIYYRARKISAERSVPIPTPETARQLELCAAPSQPLILEVLCSQAAAEMATTGLLVLAEQPDFYPIFADTLGPCLFEELAYHHLRKGYEDHHTLLSPAQTLQFFAMAFGRTLRSDNGLIASLMNTPMCDGIAWRQTPNSIQIERLFEYKSGRIPRDQVKRLRDPRKVFAALLDHQRDGLKICDAEITNDKGTSYKPVILHPKCRLSLAVPWNFANLTPSAMQIPVHSKELRRISRGLSADIQAAFNGGSKAEQTEETDQLVLTS